MRWLRGKSKKNAKARKTRRKPLPRWLARSLRGTAIVGLFALAFGGPTWLWQSGWVATAGTQLFHGLARELSDIGLRVDEIYLHGRRYESSTAISQALGIERGEPILSVDLGDARRRLEKLPWVRIASVKRELPGAIRVRIVERRPLALWQRRNELVLVDDHGVIVTRRNLERFPNLLVIVGDDAPAHATSLLSMLAHAPVLKERVNAAVRVGERRWNIRMDNGVYVRLPEKDALAAWTRFARLEQQHGLLKQDLLSIDLRIPDQLIVRTRGGRPPSERKVNLRKGKNT